jgi:hypothetical protein
MITVGVLGDKEFYRAVQFWRIATGQQSCDQAHTFFQVYHRNVHGAEYAVNGRTVVHFGHSVKGAAATDRLPVEFPVVTLWADLAGWKAQSLTVLAPGDEELPTG